MTASTRTIEYTPKGNMCLDCTKWSKDCANLDFQDMPVIFEIDHIAIVECTEFSKIERKQKCQNQN